MGQVRRAEEQDVGEMPGGGLSGQITTDPPRDAAASCLTLPRTTLADLAGLSNEDLLRRAAIGVENFDGRVFHLSDEQLDHAFLPDAGVGTWPVRALLGHLADAEMLFVARMRRAVAEDRPVLAVWDEQAFIDAGIYASAPLRAGAPAPNIGGFVATIYTLRAWMCEWLASLDPRCWTREAMHPERGPQTLRRICEYNTMHLEHHAWYMNAKIERFLGIAPVPAGVGCCGGDCACGAAGAEAGHDRTEPADAQGCGKPGCCKG